MPTFLGSGFALESVTQIAPATVRVRFTQDPKAVSGVASNDALNPANYTITGPSAVQVNNCGVVFGDTQSIDCFLVNPLAAGNYTLTVGNAVVAYDLATLISAPKSLVFTSTGTINQPGVNPGAEADGAEQVLRKHLNPSLVGPGWDAVVAAIATGDQNLDGDGNWDNALLAFDQLFKSSASGVYLERKAADDGLTRPANIGMADSLFRQYSIKTTNSKLVEPALLAILEVFYGSDSVRAFSDSQLGQPFQLGDQQQLVVLLDEQTTVTITFNAGDFANIGNATAAEVAAAITRSFRFADSDAYAVPQTDAQTGLTKVRIYSGALGLASSVRVIGGQAQNALQFLTLLPAFNALPGLPTWTVTFFPATGRVRFSATTGFDASQLLIGDYVNVYGTEFSAVNQGTWTIVNVYWTPFSQYFEVVNQFGNSDGNVVQLGLYDVAFFRPTRKVVFASPQRSVVVAALTGEVDVVLPATSSAVNRGLDLAAYGQVQNSVTISALERVQGGTVTVTTATAHGLSIGNQVQIDGIAGSPTIPGQAGGSGSEPTWTTAYSKASFFSAEPAIGNSARAAPTFSGVTVPLLDGRTWVGYGRHITGISGGVPSNVLNWMVFQPNSTTVNPGNAPSLTYTLQYSGGLQVPVGLSNVGGSQFTSPSFNYGKVVFTGGDTTTGSVVPGAPVATTTIWTPNTGVGTIASWISMNNARSAHVQVTLADGSLLVAGGMSGNNQAGATTERFTLGANSWTVKGAMNRPRAQPTFLLLKNGPLKGKVLAIGGRQLAPGHPLEHDTVGLWHMDTAVGTCVDSGPNSLTITDAAAVVATSGMAGNCRQYNGTAGGGSSRPGYDAVLGNLFLAGSYTVEGFINFANNSFGGGTTQGPFVTMGAVHGGTSATNTLFAFGMSSGVAFHLQFYCEHGSNNSTGSNWVSVNTIPNMGVPLYTWNHFACSVKPSVAFPGQWSMFAYLNGFQVEPIGGIAGNPTFDNITPPTGGGSSVLKFAEDDVPGFTFVLTNNGQLDDIRICNTAHTGQQVWNDYQNAIGVLYYEDATRIGRTIASCELYDPGSDTWSFTGSISVGRFGGKAVELPDGRVLLVGGITDGPQVPTLPGAAITPVKAAEMWNPNTGAWQPAGSLSFGRESVHAWYLPTKNQVVVWGGQYSITSELFDPVRMLWTFGPGVTSTNNTGGYSAYSNLGGYDWLWMVGGYNWAPATAYESLQQFVYIPNADRFLGGGLNGQFAVTNVLSSTQFQYITNEQQYTLYGITTGTATPIGAPPCGTIPGPYAYDPHNGVSITSAQSTSTQEMDANRQYSSVTVADATQFPDAPGWLVFNFGYANQVGPVPYFGRLSTTSLSLDFTFVWPKTVLTGASVVLLQSKGPFVPTNPQSVGSFYVTASPAGRVAAQAAIEGSVGAGIPLVNTITYPGDRGLGNEGYPTSDQNKLSDAVVVWGSDDVDDEIAALRID